MSYLKICIPNAILEGGSSEDFIQLRAAVAIFMLPQPACSFQLLQEHAVDGLLKCLSCCQRHESLLQFISLLDKVYHFSKELWRYFIFPGDVSYVNIIPQSRGCVHCMLQISSWSITINFIIPIPSGAGKSTKPQHALYRGALKCNTPLTIL